MSKLSQKLFSEYSAEDRLQMLKDNANGVEEQSYMRKFQPEQIVKMKDQLSELAIKINDITIEKKQAAKDFTDQLKPLNEEKGEILVNIKRKAEDVREVCFKFVDEEAGMTGFYNAAGDLVYARPIEPAEKQRSIFSLHKEGTND